MARPDYSEGGFRGLERKRMDYFIKTVVWAYRNCLTKKTSIPHKGNRWLSCEKGDVPVGQWGRKQSVSEWKWKRKFSECSDFERSLLLTAFVEHQRILLEINGCEGDIFNSAHDSEQGRVLRLGPKAYSISILSGKKWVYMTKGYLKTGPFLFI